jgi:hypothetical protein
MISSIGVNYFGNGSNGALVLSTSQSASATVTTADSGVTVLQYSSITLGPSSNFTASTRTQALWIYCQGNCSIGSGATLSMTARGASAVCNSNMNVTKFVAGDTTYVSTEAQQSGSTTYTSAQVGGAGGAASTSGANPGSTITNGTGGGGSGSSPNVGGSSGAGASGTAFSGGSAGSAEMFNSGSGVVAGSGSPNGGAGGSISGSGGSLTGDAGGGGAGNPGGTGLAGSGTTAQNGSNGTGGTIILIVGGTLSGTGTISSNGSAGGGVLATSYAMGGGASGAGRIIVLSTSGTLSGGTLQANGGAGGTASGGTNYNGIGGPGGAGAITSALIANPQLLANNISAISATPTPIVASASLLNTSPTLIEFNASGGSFNINLPPNTIARDFNFANLGNTVNSVTLLPNGTDLINGATSLALPSNVTIGGTTVNAQYSVSRIIADGLGNWVNSDAPASGAGTGYPSLSAGTGIGLSTAGSVTTISNTGLLSQAPAFISSAQVPSSESVINVAHGLGRVPYMVRVYIINTIAELNYSVGDKVYIDAPLYFSSNGYNGFGGGNTTNVFYNQWGTIAILNKNGVSGISNITNANWSLYLAAW